MGILKSMGLFNPTVPAEMWHPNFKAEMNHPNPWNRAVLSDWATGFSDRDGKFVKEFQTTFNSSFLELYLNAVFRELQLSVDFSFHAPDFVITRPYTFCVEAAIASNAIGAPPEHDRKHAEVPKDLNEFNHEAILRLSNALHKKHEKYKTHYSALPHVKNSPFVVALAPFDRPFFNMACQRAIQALLYNYYVDEEQWISEGVDLPAPKSELFSVAKASGAKVELGLFQSELMSEVSAVIFSTCATWGKIRALSKDPNPNIWFTAARLNTSDPTPHLIKAKKAEYQESLLDGLQVYHNPFAVRPLDPAIFRRWEVMQSYFSPQTQDWEHEQHDGQLQFRSVHTVLVASP